MYGTQVDLEARFTKERVAEVFSVQASDGSTPGTADATAIAACGADAQAEIDEILSTIAVYPLPSPTPPSVLAMWCALTLAYGIERRPELVGKDGFKPYLAAAKMTRTRLDEMRDGKRRLDPSIQSLNAGGQLQEENPSPAQPFYFVQDTNGNGGFTGGSF